MVERPPPAPPSKSARSAVEAFGEALDAAVSRVDAAVEADDHSPSPASIPVFGEHTPEPQRLPPSLAHLQAHDAKLELGAPVPVPVATSSAASGGAGAGAWVFLLLCAAGAGAAVWYFVLR